MWRGEQPVGSFCSGTDGANFVYDAFAAAVSERFNITIEFVHEFAVEYDKPKQAFIADLWPSVKCIYGDVTMMSGPTAICAKAKQPVTIKRIKTGNAGFSCTDASGLNPDSASLANRMAVAEASSWVAS
jgi:hypothetical protein